MDTNVSDARDIRLNSCFLTLALGELLLPVSSATHTQSVLEAFLYYDHLITIDREIKHIWRRHRKPSAYLFLVNRYFSFSANIIVALFQVTNFDLKRFEVSPNSELIAQMACSKLQELQPVTATSPYYKSIPILMTLRVSALYGRWSRVFGSLLVLGVAALGLAVVWMALFAYDSMVFTLTLVKTWQAAQEIRIHTRLPIIALLLRDGAIYFAYVSCSD
ncbi:hypothetical protein BD779DRAFT_1804913 [Infundibulicybe gibba]|nr:hypothetical protein BD779DRAFT_1804913 [Infundibulicybe gibba]